MGKFCCVEEYEAEAKKRLLPMAEGFYNSGADSELTLQLNKAAFQKLRLRPRVLRNVAKRDLSVTVLGKKVSIPIGVAPTGMQRMAHPMGECANARAAGSLGTVFTLSTGSNFSIEEVAEAAPQTARWFQLYIMKDRDWTAKMVRRAVAAGFSALVLTVDLSAMGKRRSDVRNKFALPPHLRLANFSDVAASRVQKAADGSALAEYVNQSFDLNITWDDVVWLKRVAGIPVIVKGILTAEDALIAANIPVDGIVVSNHGGRQLDGSPATIEALPEIARAVGDRVDVYLDGGIRTGTDVFRALALGAKMVFVGRPAIWGLACDGEEGVRDVLKLLASELDVAMALTGCRAVSDIKPEMVVHESWYSKI